MSCVSVDMEKGPDGKYRCFGNKPGQDLYAAYHDKEWGRPVHDDKKLFEMLILEGAQAGLSWETILKRRKGYREAFHQFDVIKVSRMTDTQLERLRENPAIIRNRLKIYSARNNAHAFRNIQAAFTSFDKYIWSFVDNTPIINYPKTWKQVPATTALSDKIAKDLKKRGMSFVGSTIIYAYMQSIGMVDDHLVGCCCCRK